MAAAVAVDTETETQICLPGCGGFLALPMQITLFWGWKVAIWPLLILCGSPIKALNNRTPKVKVIARIFLTPKFFWRKLYEKFFQKNIFLTISKKKKKEIRFSTIAEGLNKYVIATTSAEPNKPMPKPVNEMAASPPIFLPESFAFVFDDDMN